MSNRCEPPPELRGVDGWHWVQAGENPAECWRWTSHGKYWQSTTAMSVRQASSYGYRYIAPVATPAEVGALRAEVMRAGAECADMGAEIVRLRAEVASLRVTLGQQPPAEGAEPIGCPLPGMCSMVAATSTLRARVAELEAALHGIANWCEAYPASVFPQANADAALASCKAAGIPTDAMHGTWARHLLAGIGRDARAALEGNSHD